MAASSSSSSPPTNIKATNLGTNYEPSDVDVVCGRGRLKQEGNRRFRTVVLHHLDAYLNASTRFEKSLVIFRIVRSIRAVGGRFVRKQFDGTSDMVWMDIGDKAAREKVGHALRDAFAANEKQQHQQHQQGGGTTTTTENHNHQQQKQNQQQNQDEEEEEDSPPPNAPKSSSSFDFPMSASSEQRRPSATRKFGTIETEGPQTSTSHDDMDETSRTEKRIRRMKVTTTTDTMKGGASSPNEESSSCSSADSASSSLTQSARRAHHHHHRRHHSTNRPRGMLARTPSVTNRNKPPSTYESLCCTGSSDSAPSFPSRSRLPHDEFQNISMEETTPTTKTAPSVVIVKDRSLAVPVRTIKRSYSASDAASFRSQYQQSPRRWTRREQSDSLIGHIKHNLSDPPMIVEHFHERMNSISGGWWEGAPPEGENFLRDVRDDDDDEDEPVGDPLPIDAAAGVKDDDSFVRFLVEMFGGAHASDVTEEEQHHHHLCTY